MEKISGPLRWGFMGGGKIFVEFVSALKTLNKSHHQPLGLACRNGEDAKRISVEHGIPKFYDSYSALAADPEIDIVYIGTVQSGHYEQAKLAIENGKHALVEKPFSLTGKEAKDLVRMARERKVFLMEGYWTRFFPAYQAMMEEIENGKIGQVHEAILTVGNICSHFDRFRLLELGGGSLMNHGVYGIMMATRIFGRPDTVTASGHLSDSGVDLDTTFVMKYNQGYSAVTICNSLVKMPGEFYAIGTKGTLKLPWPYWCPTILQSSVDGVKEFALPNLTSSAKGVNTVGFVYEIEEVRRCIEQGLLESPQMPLDETVLILEVCDEVRRQLGVKYVQD